jgi:hypothetical protein
MDKFILTEKDYKRKIKLEKEKEERKDLIYHPKPFKKDMYYFKNDTYKGTNKFQNDFFNIRENGDILLNNWIIKQKDPIVVFLSEFITGTKISKDMERFRPIIQTTPTISIEIYRKQKKIGDEGVEYLKRLKDRYGIIVLKALWANLKF